MVIHVIPAYKPAYIYGGPTVSVSSLCEELAKVQIEVQVLTTTANGRNEFELKAEKGVILHHVKVNYFKRELRGQVHLSIQLLLFLYTLLKSNKSVVHIHSWWNATSILSCIIAISLKTKVVLSPRGMLTPYSLNNRHRILKWLIHHILGKWLIKCCQIHATTELERDDILKLIAHNNIVVIPNYLKPSFSYKTAHTTKSGNKSSFRLLFLSRIEEKKGLDLLLSALPLLDFNCSLTIGGTGSEKYVQLLKKSIKTQEIKTKIDWVGFVNERQRVNLLNTHDLLVLFSWNENFANIVIESLSYGLPVALSCKVGLSDFVIANDLGWVCDPNREAIAATIRDAWINETKRIAIRKKSKFVIERSFHVKEILPKYISLYINK
ncbi:MAG: glycosyltransferase [Bacteroidota bacterium]